MFMTNLMEQLSQLKVRKEELVLTKHLFEMPKQKHNFGLSINSLKHGNQKFTNVWKFRCNFLQHFELNLLNWKSPEVDQQIQHLSMIQSNQVVKLK